MEAETAEDMADWVSDIKNALDVLVYAKKAKEAAKQAKRKKLIILIIKLR